METDGVGGLSSATYKSPGESRCCVGRLLVPPQEGRQQRGDAGSLQGLSGVIKEGREAVGKGDQAFPLSLSLIHI